MAKKHKALCRQREYGCAELIRQQPVENQVHHCAEVVHGLAEHHLFRYAVTAILYYYDYGSQYQKFFDAKRPQKTRAQRAYRIHYVVRMRYKERPFRLRKGQEP